MRSRRTRRTQSEPHPSTTRPNCAGAKPFEPMPGRVMKEYVEMPKEMLDSPAELKRWIKRGVAYTKMLPPRGKKK